MMPSHEIDELGRDIKKNGQRIPIVLYGGKILDGRNRYEACQRLGIEPKVMQFNKGNPKDYIASINYFRKHWTTGERANFAALMSISSEVGSPETKPDLIAPNGAIPSVEEPITQNEAAKVMSVSRRSVQRAKAKIKGKTVNVADKMEEHGDVDACGVSIPDTAKPYWRRKSEANNVLNQIKAAKGQVKKLMPDDPMYCEVNLNGVMSDLNGAINRFSAAIPAHVCPYCKGNAENCKPCKGRGVVSEYFWKTAVPAEMK